MTHFTRYLLLNTACIGLLCVAWLSGLLDVVWTADKTHLTKLIAVVFLCGLVLCGWKIARLRPKGEDAMAHDIGLVRQIAGWLVMLGLIGTVVGFIIALSGVDADAAADVKAITPMVSTLLEGMGTAMHTTLVGAVGNIWLMACYRLLRSRALEVVA